MRLLDDEAMEALYEIRDGIEEQLTVLREIAGSLERQARSAAGFAAILQAGRPETEYRGADDLEEGEA